MNLTNECDEQPIAGGFTGSACCPFQELTKSSKTAWKRPTGVKMQPRPTCNPGLLFPPQHLDSERVPVVDSDVFVSPRQRTSECSQT
ncbi:hypothetical protein CEXT_806541 [Caerostris extrusa]|uniref:Uncharacterized protein n=1 Tax=Caerostris extrusa TaxID=172846 RepID=A0AAV4UCE5_CAEEX|nr:hypothetical protein CEXT_806541 [Caerostris extrusa]